MAERYLQEFAGLLDKFNVESTSSDMKYNLPMAVGECTSSIAMQSKNVGSMEYQYIVNPIALPLLFQDFDLPKQRCFVKHKKHKAATKKAKLCCCCWD